MEPRKVEEPMVGNPKEPEPLEPDFTRELAAYERHRERLERDHLYQTALLHGDELVGVFEDLQDAGREGYRRFGARPFLLKEIGDPVHWVPLAVFPTDGNDPSR